MKSNLRKVIAAVMALVMCLCLTACSGANYTENNTEYVIGVSGPLTGAAAVYGVAVQNSAQMAVDEINAAGGLNGYKFKLVATDDQHDPTKVATNYATLLEKNYHRYPALIPTSPFMDDKAPEKIKKLKMTWTMQGPVLNWQAPKAKTEMDKAIQYVVYRFAKGEKVNLADASKIVTITRDNFILLPYEDGKVKYQYVVTALDRLHNESKGVKKTVKL